MMPTSAVATMIILLRLGQGLWGFERKGKGCGRGPGCDCFFFFFVFAVCLASAYFGNIDMVFGYHSPQYRVWQLLHFLFLSKIPIEVKIDNIDKHAKYVHGMSNLC